MSFEYVHYFLTSLISFPRQAQDVTMFRQFQEKEMPIFISKFVNLKRTISEI